jgi:hypothetical protein
LQRSLQNGFQRCDCDHSTSFPQVGQDTVFIVEAAGMLLVPAMAIAQGQMAQQASPNSTFSSVCLARFSMVEKFRKRAVNRCRPPLNSAK